MQFVTKKIKNYCFKSACFMNKDGYRLSLPAGLKVREIESRPGEYFLDEFPEKIFPKGSSLRHDAEHYGLLLEHRHVEPLVAQVGDCCFEAYKRFTKGLI